MAAAVSASFNAPIAGVFFALEVILGHYALEAFAPIIIASVTGAIITRIHIGDSPAFRLDDYVIGSFFELPAFAILGVVCAVVAVLFMRSIFFADDGFERLKIPIWARPAVAGLPVGGIGVFYPHILGVGYGATDEALKEMYPLGLLLILVVAKIAATALTLGGRFGGGVFSPSLFLGAMIGGAFGMIAAIPFPDLAASNGVYAIVGMGAIASVVLGAPISAILIVFELTGDYQVVIAVMVASLVATVVSRAIVGKSFFHWQLERQGLALAQGRLHHVLENLQVKDLLSDNCPTVSENEPLSGVRSLLDGSPEDHILVVTEESLYVGTIGFRELGAADLTCEGLSAKDISSVDSVVLEAATTLERALEQVRLSAEDRLPVVEICAP